MIKVEHISKIYTRDTVETIALDDVSFKIDQGEFVAIMGPSGSGKSTLMHILGALDNPTAGKYYLDDLDVFEASDDELAHIRNKKIGFIFQSFNLLPRSTTLKNIMVPMMYGGVPKEERPERARKLLDMVGLLDRAEHTSNQLSGGQQQRVAIARSLAMNPSIILADEPTGNLPTNQSEEIIGIFQKLNEEGHTIIIITHEPEIASYTKRTIFIRDGKIAEDKINGDQRAPGYSREVDN
jgi:putative ABC transport system ATP-binding protein